MKKEWTFEDLPMPSDITLGLDYTYYHNPGRLYGPPEFCYPPETECEITLPKGWEDAVIQTYIQAARKAIKEIEAQVKEMIEDELPKEWAEEDYYDMAA